jgi:hypothetical protein
LSSILYAVAVAAGLFAGMLVLLEVGRRIGARRVAADPEGAHAGTGAVDGAVFALMGLMIAFTFSGAASRFDTRRQLVVEEANDIGTAYLRVVLLPAETQPALRDLFRKYVESRLATYRAFPDRAAANAELERSLALQGEIWTRSVEACRIAKETATTTLILAALNAMIDIVTTRTAALQMHPPPIVFIMLVGLALGCALLAGQGMAGAKTRDWTRLVAFAAIMAVTVYVILDLEYPRIGLMRVDAFDRHLVDVRNAMK